MIRIEISSYHNNKGQQHPTTRGIERDQFETNLIFFRIIKRKKKEIGFDYKMIKRVWNWQVLDHQINSLVWQIYIYICLYLYNRFLHESKN